MKEVFDLFIDPDNTRDDFTSPFIKGEYVYATEAHRMVWCKKEDTLIDVTKTNDLAVESVIPQANMMFPLDWQADDFLKYKTVPEIKSGYKDCEECMGVGDVEWEYRGYYRDFDCPKCDGMGELKYETETGDLGFGLKKVKIGDSFFYLWNFINILKAQSLIKKPLYITYYSDQNNSLMLQCGYFYMIIQRTLDPNLFAVAEIDLKQETK